MDEILDFSPFNFIHGINPKRLLRGRTSISKGQLLKFLTCNFCNYIMVQGKECQICEQNFCTPCIKRWEATESALYFTTPCKCQTDRLKLINKLKQEFLEQIKFRCANKNCHYQMSYDELILGTHELDECNFIRIICEGCGSRILKQEQIKHESLECKSPSTKCRFCSQIIKIRDI